MMLSRLLARTRGTALAVLLLLASFGTMLAAESRSAEGAPGDKLYWSDGGAGKIQRSDLDGSSVEDILTGLPGPGDIAIDPYAGKIYFTSGLGIQRANLDGTGLEVAVSGVPAFRIALDPIRSKVYWTELGERIRRANYDGTDVEDLVTTGFDFAGPFGIAVDAPKGILYWSDTVVIKQANLDGTGAALARNTGFVGPIDLAGQALVWIEYLPFTGTTILCDIASIEPAGASADVPAAMATGAEGVYWADNAASCIGLPSEPKPTVGEPRIRRTSGGTTVDLVTGLSHASGVAIALADPPPLKTATATPPPTATPDPVGGVSLSTGLAPLSAAEERGASATPWVAAAALAGVGVALGGAWYARRRLAARA